MFELLGSELKFLEQRNPWSKKDLEEVENNIDFQRRALMYLEELEGGGRVSTS